MDRPREFRLRRSGVVRRFLRVLLLGLLLALFLALFAVGAGPAAAGEGFFGPPTNYPAGTTPNSVAVGDFNADGDPDLAVVNSDSDDVSILLGAAGGTFTGPSSIPVEDHPLAVAVGEFNGDTDPDLAVTNNGDDNVSILLGGAAASFTSPTSLAVGDAPTSVAVGDFNGDADPDLAVTNSNDDTVSILLGDIGGNFTGPTNFVVGDFFDDDRPVSVAINDFNGDGDPDLAVANMNADDLAILLGGSEGTFSLPSAFPVGDGPISVATGQFDGDGDPDLAVANVNADTVSVVLGDVGGTFSPSGFLSVGDAPTSVMVGEFDGDDDPDLAVANNGDDDVSIFLGGGGGFTPGGPFEAGDAPTSVAAGEFDGDGDPDLAVTNGADDNVSIVLAVLPPYVVTDTGDFDDGNCDGICSLREAINAANGDGEYSRITFDINGTGVQTISPTLPLPAITQPVIIDGYTQMNDEASPNTLATGNNALLLIELDGSAVPPQNITGTITDGLTITGGGSTVQGLAIKSFEGYGIDLQTEGSNLIAGNFIGTNAAGTASYPNDLGGIVADSEDNVIGGTSPGARNLISSNFEGVRFTGAGATGNIVQGNYIGTNAAGTADLGNTADGIFIDGAPNNTIGGTAAGARNVISGNDNQGVYIHGGGATGNTVLGNYIGTNAAGTADLGNTNDGVVIDLTSSTTIGGTAAGAGNVISGNNTNGVRIVLSSGTTLQGNSIGTNAAGTADLGNSLDGILIDRAMSSTIGGTAAGARNVISGNDGEGVEINGGLATGNIVQGNYICTNAAGAAALGNSGPGIRIQGSPSNTVGGTASGATNLIAGNASHGVLIQGFGGTGNTVQGNYIGTDVTGEFDLGNTTDGVHISEGTNNTVGGTASGARNVISGNNGDGVRTSGVNGATIQGNYIGTNAPGTLGLGNNGKGVSVTGSANIMVGGAAAGTGNVISSNGLAGVYVEGCCGTNTIQGNFIGTNAAGTGALGNTNGVVTFSSNVVVGGTTVAARNVISGNNGNGLVLSSSFITVQGNYIGTDVDGDTDLGNSQIGVLIDGASNTIGGTAAGARNVISGNDASGVALTGNGASSNTVLGNYIGINAAGDQDLGNLFDGVHINGAPGNTIGGTAGGARNVISGNQEAGIQLAGNAASGNTVQGNLIGTDAAGTEDLGNSAEGIHVLEAPNSTIGGTADGAGNVISGNGGAGIEIQGVGATATTVQGNLIGTDATGTSALGNTARGVSIFNASDNAIGGAISGAGNVVAFNGSYGVVVHDLGEPTGNLIRGNSIHSNIVLGIDLIGDGVTPNDAGDDDGGPNELQNFPVLTDVFGAGGSTTVEGTLNSTPDTDFELDFFKNDQCDPSRHGEGQTYLGSTTVSTDGSGNVSFSETVPGPVTAGQFVTGTATDPNGNTSEFSLCDPPPPIVVTNTNDSGPGSFRAAISSGNVSPGPDTIEFDLPGPGYTVDVASPLPAITDPVVIDGTTQPGFSGTPIVELNGAGAGATGDGLKITAGDSTVKGLVINGFSGDGIELNGGNGNVIRGNYIGTNAAGTAEDGNSVGIRVVDSSGNFIGGAAGGAGNLISGNAGRGMALLGAGSTGNVIRGNLIGTDAAGTADLGNGVHGVSISLNSSNTNIGGQGPNTIAFNGDDGVWIGSGIGNRILRNSIHSNGGLGIDLGTDGVTPNDPADEDGSPNMLQNFPALDAALVGGGATAVFGTLESAADTDYRLHFWHNASCDISGHGEGETYLGSKLVSTDGDGLVSFRATFAQIAQNRHVTAVAVDPAGNTSEFSGCEQTTLRPTLAIDDVTVGEGNSDTTPATFTVTRSGNTGGTSTVNFTTANVSAVAPGDYTTTSGTLSFASGETTKTITVNVAGDVLDEANETFRVNLSAPVDATISDSQGVGTITDDDPTPTLSINDVTVVEGDSGTARAIFTVSLSGASGQKVTVNYATANGTATAPGDYSSRSGTLSFSPGVTTQSITVRVNGDNAVEADETYFVNLSGATNATISDGQGQGTIQNDD